MNQVMEKARVLQGMNQARSSIIIIILGFPFSNENMLHECFAHPSFISPAFTFAESNEVERGERSSGGGILSMNPIPIVLACTRP